MTNITKSYKRVKVTKQDDFSVTFCVAVHVTNFLLRKLLKFINAEFIFKPKNLIHYEKSTSNLLGSYTFFIGCEKNDYNDFDGSSYNDVADFRLSFDYHEEWGTIKELPFEFNSTNYNMAKYGHVHNDVMNQLRDVLMEIDYCDPEEMSNYIVAIDSVKALNNLNLFDTWVFESGLDQL